MGTRTTVNILRVLAAIIGVCLVTFNPDLSVVVYTTKVEVTIIRAAGVALVLVGVFLPVIQSKLTVVGRGR